MSKEDKAAIKEQLNKFSPEELGKMGAKALVRALEDSLGRERDAFKDLREYAGALALARIQGACVSCVVARCVRWLGAVSAHRPSNSACREMLARSCWQGRTACREAFALHSLSRALGSEPDRRGRERFGR